VTVAEVGDSRRFGELPNWATVAVFGDRRRFCHFKGDHDEIWQVFSSSKFASTDRVGFLI